jgi:hypothetical protein
VRADAEFSKYIDSAERRLALLDGVIPDRLRRICESLRSRFRDDLGEGRDLLVSEAAALMVAEAYIREIGIEQDAAPAAGSNEETVDLAALAVAYVSLHDETRVWKTIDYSITQRWHARGWSEDPRGHSKSVALTLEGLEKAREASERLFGAPAGRV